MFNKYINYIVFFLHSLVSCFSSAYILSSLKWNEIMVFHKSIIRRKRMMMFIKILISDVYNISGGNLLCNHVWLCNNKMSNYLNEILANVKDNHSWPLTTVKYGSNWICSFAQQNKNGMNLKINKTKAISQYIL